MSTHTVHRTRVAPARSLPEASRRTLTLIGAGALVVGACLHWTGNTLGTNMTFRSLLKEDFTARTDVVQTTGGIAVLLGIAALVGLVDRRAWLSRLAGLAAIALFAMFAIEVYRSSGRSLQLGAWLVLAGGIVLLFGGAVHERRHRDEAAAPQTMTQPTRESTRRNAATDLGATTDNGTGDYTSTNGSTGSGNTTGINTAHDKSESITRDAWTPKV